MKMIRVYRNANCAKCARFAGILPFIDWFGRVDASTEAPNTGPLRLGEVVVEELASGRILGGANGIELISRHIPAYAPLRLLLRVPAFRSYVEQEVSGRDGDACVVKTPAGKA